MASAKFQGNFNVSETASFIKREVNNLGITVELVGESRYNRENFQVYMFVFEKYYYRSANRASLSVLVIGDEEISNIEVISSGAGQGLLFKFSWGADKNFVNGLGKLLISKGYKQIM
ncbi:MAG: DUF6054 family protein [Candidatus Izemoplasmatales bacterium]|nr:DUF6054 family protein [Candidatus Izemoplasmatales bacterium]